MENYDVGIGEKISYRIYDKENNKCKGEIVFEDIGLRIDGFSLCFADNGGVQVFMPKAYGTTWPHRELISWAEVREKLKKLFVEEIDRKEEADEEHEIKVELSELKKDGYCYVTITFYDGTVVKGFRVGRASNGGIQVCFPKNTRSTFWRYDRYVSWKKMQAIIKEKYMESNSFGVKKVKDKAINFIDVSVKFHSVDTNGSCFANCHLKKENVRINNILMRFDSEEITVDMPEDIEEKIHIAVPMEELKSFLIGKLEKFFSAMKLDFKKLKDIDSTNSNEFWLSGVKGTVDVLKDVEKTAVDFDWRLILGEHNANSNVSPLAFVPNTVLRLEEYIEKHELIKSEKKSGKKRVDFNSSIPLDSLISALTQNDFISSFELDVLTWINRLRYVTTAMLMDLYVSGYIAPSWRKITKDKFSVIINRMQKYNLVNVTRFASFNDASQAFDSKAISRVYTLGKNGNVLLRQLGREGSYSAFDIYQDGNVVKNYMAANQHLVRWLAAYPSYINNNYETNHIVYALGSKKTGARLGALVRCGSGTVIIEAVRRSDRWTYDESSAFLRDKLTRIISLVSDFDNLYHRSIFGGSEKKYELSENPVICYTCEDEEHVKEIWNIIKPVAVENPTQKIWFTHDLNVYNDSAEGKRYVEFSADDVCSVVDVNSLFGLGKERDYAFLYDKG